MIGAGEYRHVITIEQPNTNKSSSGAPIATWSTFATIRCRVWPGKGNEATMSLRDTGTTTTRFFFRHIPGILNGMRLVFGTRYYDIANVCNVGEMNREIEITAVEKT